MQLRRLSRRAPPAPTGLLALLLAVCPLARAAAAVPEPGAIVLPQDVDAPTRASDAEAVAAAVAADAGALADVQLPALRRLQQLLSGFNNAGPGLMGGAGALLGQGLGADYGGMNDVSGRNPAYANMLMNSNRYITASDMTYQPALPCPTL
jgi:hypothetical protein